MKKGSRRPKLWYLFGVFTKEHTVIGVFPRMAKSEVLVVKPETGDYTLRLIDEPIDQYQAARTRANILKTLYSGVVHRGCSKIYTRYDAKTGYLRRQTKAAFVDRNPPNSVNREFEFS